MTNKYSCIIAAFNENPRILDVLKVVVRTAGIDEIIVVDDGSTDQTPQIISAAFPEVTLITHSQNKGKTQAIRTGIEASSSEYLLLLDADLVGLEASEITRSLEVFEQHKLDCLVMLTEADKYSKLVRKIVKWTAYVAGDRIVSKKLMLDVLADSSLKNYGLEIAQNKYLLANNCKVGRFQLSAIDLGKSSKHGLIKGIIGEIKMWRDIFKTAGFKFFFQQKALFSDKVLK